MKKMAVTPNPAGLLFHAAAKLKCSAANIACVTPQPGQRIPSRSLAKQVCGICTSKGVAAIAVTLERRIDKCVREGSDIGSLEIKLRGQKSISTVQSNPAGHDR